MSLIKKYSAVASLLAILSTQQTSFAQTPDKNTRYQAPSTTQSAVIDGELNDALWQDAIKFDLNLVNDPYENTPSPVKTTAMLIENGEYIYIAFIADDPNPSKIQSFLGDRDTKWGDDIVGIKLDTFNHRRLNYEFFVNALGVQNDSIKNVMTGESNTAWDGIWESYGKITDKGFQVEIAIPYRILNFDAENQTKQWAFELLRMYPRDNRLRISHVPLNRDDACWLCQYPILEGFEQAKVGKNIMLTPALVANRHETRNVYVDQDWQSENDIEASLDLRWGINSNTLLNLTLNPDFSTVESDAGQLSINKTFSLFFEEKRPFFLENSDYFSSNYDLVYTRNIADPDYGAKLTGTEDKHSYGIFVSHDTETNFIVPGNTSSDIASLGIESHSGSLRYRYDANDDWSIGTIGTFRQADEYHNYVFGLDTKYKLDESNSLTAQLLSSESKYPSQLFKDFCYAEGDGACEAPEDVDCNFADCDFSEQVLRTKKDNSFTDQALKLGFLHESEYWNIALNHQQIGADFRADLGFMPRADYEVSEALVEHYFYGDETSWWTETALYGEWNIKHNEQGELLEKTYAAGIGVDGPMLSYFEYYIYRTDKVGLRHDESVLNIDGNTTLFEQDSMYIYGSLQPRPDLYTHFKYEWGDRIDYSNNRLGDHYKFDLNVTYNVTKHLELDYFFTSSQLDAKPAHNASAEYVYKAALNELRLTYQFDVKSYLKLNLVHSDIERNPDNNPFIGVSETNKDLSTQLIYAYKVNPQTVFFLGYSDSSVQDDLLNSLERKERTFFTKISYAWMK